MPKGPKGEKRPADVNARAVMIAKIATGEIEDMVPSPEDEGKDPAAVALGRKGGKARAERIRQPGEPAHRHAHRQVLPLGM
jgi:hypothetical protein